MLEASYTLLIKTYVLCDFIHLWFYNIIVQKKNIYYKYNIKLMPYNCKLNKIKKQYNMQVLRIDIIFS